jgi:hypothetical protein
MTQGQTTRRYVVWRTDGNGHWYPSQAMPRSDAFKLAEQLERDGVPFVIALAPKFDPQDE